MNSGPRWLIGLLMAFILLTIISNVIEQADVLTASQVVEMQTMTSSHELTEAQATDTGGVMSYGTLPTNFWEAIFKAVTADYSFWYEIDTTLATQATCEAANGKWDTDTSSCAVPNDFMPIRYILFWPITIAMIVEIVLTIRRFWSL